MADAPFHVVVEPGRVIAGNAGLHSIVNGERCPMEANDLVLSARYGECRVTAIKPVYVEPWLCVETEAMDDRMLKGRQILWMVHEHN